MSSRLHFFGNNRQLFSHERIKQCTLTRIGSSKYVYKTCFHWNLQKKTPPSAGLSFVAKGRIELPTFGLWAQRATAALLRDVERKGNGKEFSNQTKKRFWICFWRISHYNKKNFHWGSFFMTILLYNLRSAFRNAAGAACFKVADYPITFVFYVTGTAGTSR